LFWSARWWNEDRLVILLPNVMANTGDSPISKGWPGEDSVPNKFYFDSTAH